MYCIYNESKGSTLIDNMQVFCTIILQNVIISAFCSTCSKLYTLFYPGRECLCRGLHTFGVGCGSYVLREVAFWGSVGVVCLLRESVFPVTGERSFCYGRAFFLLREADFSVGRIDFSTSRKCFSAFAQAHLSPLTSVFVYSCRCFFVLLQAHHVLCMSSWRVCKQGFSPAPPCPAAAPCGGAVRC